MKLYFRELTIDDIPDIQEISKNIWDGEDYIPQVIEKWLQDKNCMNYGAFINEDLDEIVGFGRVKLYDNKLAINVKYEFYKYIDLAGVEPAKHNLESRPRPVAQAYIQ